jgi:tRNA threonylcarbamoyl adenosine modification protein YeaZ
MAAIDLAFEDAQLDREELGVVLTSRGPGSFTGIRSGIATALGLAAGIEAEVMAYSSLLIQAARQRSKGCVWTAQPGRKGEVYAQQFELESGSMPRMLSPIKILNTTDVQDLGPWIAPEGLELGGAKRVLDLSTGAEALIRLKNLGVVSDPVEPLYVEGPPIHTKKA